MQTQQLNADNPQLPKLWGLMDCNNFYASCERIFRPDLQNRPIVVLSNNDGCIVARSAEAKALGIPMGAPEFQQRALLKKHGVAVFSSNYALYGDISNRVMQVTETVTPDVEQYSIDEAFIPFTGAIHTNAEQVCVELRERIFKWTGITVSIGLGSTKTLAKLANHLAKKNSGIFTFPTIKAEQDVLLAQIPVGEVWGIGRRYAAKLRMYDVLTAKALRDKDNLWLRKVLSITGLHTAMELRGIPCVAETSPSSICQSLVSSRSFGVRVYNKSDLAEALSSFTANAVARLRRENLLANGIAVHIRSSRHAQDRYAETINITLSKPTADTKTFLQAAMRGLEMAFKEGIAYAKAGVMLYDICPANSYQGSLLTVLDPEQEKHDVRSTKLMSALDAINNRFGRHTLKYASEGLDMNATWRMRQKYLSPRFTAGWDTLPVAMCK